MISQSFKKKFACSLIWASIQSWSSQLCIAIIFFIIARMISPSELGVFSLTMVVVNIIQAPFVSGFSDGLVRSDDLSQRKLSTAFWFICLFSLGIQLLVYYSAFGIATLFAEDRLEPVLQVVSFLFPIMGLGVIPEVILRRAMKFKLLAIKSLVSVVVSGSVAVFMVFSGLSYWGLVGQLLIQYALGFLILLGMTRWLPSLVLSYREMAPVIRFSVYATMERLFNMLNLRADQAIIGYFKGVSAVGIYDLSKTFMRTFIRSYGGAMNAVYLPAFTKIREDREGSLRLYYYLVELTSYVIIPVFVGLFFVCGEIVYLLLGEQWVEAIPVMKAFCFLGILQGIMLINSSIFFTYGKSDWRMWLTLINVVLDLSLCFFLIKYGLVYVAIAISARAYILMPLTLFVLSKILPISFEKYVSALWRAVCSTMVMAFCLALFSVDSVILHPLLRLMVKVALGVSVYGLVLFAIGKERMKLLFQKLKALFA